MQIKSTIIYYNIYPLEFLKKKKKDNSTNDDKDKEKLNRLHIPRGNARWYDLYGKELRVSLKTKHTASIQSSYCTPGYLSQRN